MQNELTHHGVLGMKWGVRRYQRKDGTLTKAGKKRMQVYKDAAAMAVKGKEYSDKEYKRYTKLAEKAEKATQKNWSKADIQKQLRKDFGNDIDSESGRQAIKRVYEIDDLNKYARDRLNENYDVERYRDLANYYKKTGESYVRLQQKFNNMTVNDINKKSLKQAEAFTKHYFGGAMEYRQAKAFEMDAKDWRSTSWMYDVKAD